MAFFELCLELNVSLISWCPNLPPALRWGCPRSEQSRTFPCLEWLPGAWLCPPGCQDTTDSYSACHPSRSQSLPTAAVQPLIPSPYSQPGWPCHLFLMQNPALALGKAPVLGDCPAWCSFSVGWMPSFWLHLGKAISTTWLKFITLFSSPCEAKCTFPFTFCQFTALKLKYLKWLLRSGVSSDSLQLGVWPRYMCMLLQKVVE